MPKILWLVSVTLPEAAAAVGLPAGQVGGGWLSGMLAALPAELPLTVVSVDARTKTARSGKTDGVRYLVVPDVPDSGRFWPGCSRTLSTSGAPNIPRPLPCSRRPRGRTCRYWLAFRGLCATAPNTCVTMCRRSTGIPTGYSGALTGWCPAAFWIKCRQTLTHWRKARPRLLAGARHVTGRTGFDRRAVARLAPDARYYPCNETLRPVFWQSAGSWRAREYGQGPVLLLSQGNYPLKNLHTLLKAMPAVLREWPGAVLRIAGWPPLDKGKLLRPVIDAMFPYPDLVQKLIARANWKDMYSIPGLCRRHRCGRRIWMRICSC